MDTIKLSDLQKIAEEKKYGLTDEGVGTFRGRKYHIITGKIQEYKWGNGLVGLLKFLGLFIFTGGIIGAAFSQTVRDQFLDSFSKMDSGFSRKVWRVDVGNENSIDDLTLRALTYNGNVDRTRIEALKHIRENESIEGSIPIVIQDQELLLAATISNPNLITHLLKMQVDVLLRDLNWGPSDFQKLFLNAVEKNPAVLNPLMQKNELLIKLGLLDEDNKKAFLKEAVKRNPEAIKHIPENLNLPLLLDLIKAQPAIFDELDEERKGEIVEFSPSIYKFDPSLRKKVLPYLGLRDRRVMDLIDRPVPKGSQESQQYKEELLSAVNDYGILYELVPDEYRDLDLLIASVHGGRSGNIRFADPKIFEDKEIVDKFLKANAFVFSSFPPHLQTVENAIKAVLRYPHFYTLLPPQFKSNPDVALQAVVRYNDLIMQVPDSIKNNRKWLLDLCSKDSSLCYKQSVKEAIIKLVGQDNFGDFVNEATARS